MNKIGILGSGIVAQTLGAGLIKHGYNVMLGTSNPDKLTAWLANEGKGSEVGSFGQAAAYGDLLILAIKGTAAKSVLEIIESASLKDKVIMDTTNPIAEQPPSNGVLTFFTDQNNSLMEDLQNTFPASRFVKAYNSVGSGQMVNPDYSEKPSMFICGNDVEAKKAIAEIVEIFGWEVEDMGFAEAARAIEPLCMLWCIPGFLSGQWGHAFKLLK